MTKFAPIVAALGVLGLGLAPATAQEHTWDMPNEYGASSLPGQADAAFARLVNEYSDGRIEVVNHFGGALGYKSRDHMQAVEDGAVPLASTYGGTFIGMAPIWQFQSLPFLATSPEESRASVVAAKPWYDRALAQSGQFTLMFAPWTPQGIWANKPITSVEDLRGLKIRTFDANSTEAMRAAGASPIQLSWADVIPALATGTIEAVITSDEGGVSAKFWEHLSHFTNLNFSMGLNTVHMSLEVFADLPRDLQLAVLQAAEEAENEAWARTRERIKQNVQTMKDNGMTYVPVEEVPDEFIEHLKQASAPLMDDWQSAMGPEADLILAKYYRLIGR